LCLEKGKGKGKGKGGGMETLVACLHALSTYSSFSQLGSSILDKKSLEDNILMNSSLDQQQAKEVLFTLPAHRPIFLRISPLLRGGCFGDSTNCVRHIISWIAFSIRFDD